MQPSLESMHPLIYPETVTTSPAASPFWWLGLLPLLLALAVFLLRRKKNHRPDTPHAAAMPANQLNDALSQMEQLQPPGHDEQAGPWLQQLNLLLKRFCAVRYPDVASHRLSGREWLAFLDSRCPAAGLTRWMVLVQGSYLPDCRLNQQDSHALHQAVITWMRAHV